MHDISDDNFVILMENRLHDLGIRYPSAILVYLPALDLLSRAPSITVVRAVIELVLSCDIYFDLEFSVIFLVYKKAYIYFRLLIMKLWLGLYPLRIFPIFLRRIRGVLF